MFKAQGASVPSKKISRISSHLLYHRDSYVLDLIVIRKVEVLVSGEPLQLRRGF